MILYIEIFVCMCLVCFVGSILYLLVVALCGVVIKSQYLRLLIHDVLFNQEGSPSSLVKVTMERMDIECILTNIVTGNTMSCNQSCLLLICNMLPSLLDKCL